MNSLTIIAHSALTMPLKYIPEGMVVNCGVLTTYCAYLMAIAMMVSGNSLMFMCNDPLHVCVSISEKKWEEVLERAKSDSLVNTILDEYLDIKGTRESESDLSDFILFCVRHLMVQLVEIRNNDTQKYDINAHRRAYRVSNYLDNLVDPYDEDTLKWGCKVYKLPSYSVFSILSGVEESVVIKLEEKHGKKFDPECVFSAMRMIRLTVSRYKHVLDEHIVDIIGHNVNAYVHMVGESRRGMVV